MYEELNCGGSDFGCTAAYDVDMCEGCPRNSYCYKVHMAFLREELKSGAFTMYVPVRKKQYNEINK